ncbi:filamentous hemagglutinin family outer membrane protein [Calothrix parasitica NIES-267]|uniref:Filamentous hemagglutinin family outer membrane protein n=1 Tax=Calothrix parasitica NIES-267 TaxID=1973488 RepID=A0A1Z4LLR2_9CYAN|nr:filamentous hemagglutinin family outer membrane protein [Calothrix parasitica NIES-267]
MKGIAFLSGLLGVLIIFGNLPVKAQVNSDGTTNTTVNLNNNNFTIINGIQKGNNLFHSFSEFSIPTGGSATFNNSNDVVNIINEEINVSAKNLNILDGASITSANFGSGKGGDIEINITQNLTMSGFNEVLFGPTSISSTAYRTGNSGNITINTSNLSLLTGGAIGSSTLAEGSGGELTVNASKSINVTGNLESSALVLNEIFRQNAGLPDFPRGDSGNLIINTPSLIVTDNGIVGVSNDGLGNSGDLEINTNQIFLDKEGRINAFSASGQGGSIELNIQDSLLLRNNSSINTEARSTGNGGNITINSPVIAGFENSDIIANAVEGNGGNIDITTQGIFGLEFRNELTEESDITASSQFGVNGTVAINNVNIDPNSGLVELPTELTDSSQQIASGCSTNSGSTFVATGRGGIPQNPNERVDLNPSWSDIRNLSAYRKRNNNTVENTQISQISNKPAIVEATGFIRNENGKIELIALSPTSLPIKKLSECSGLNT